MSIDTFIANALAQVDDLSELKVCVVALRLLEQKQSLTAHVTFDDLANHAALRDGLGFPFHLKLESALRYAVARGTLLASSDELRTAKIFANNAQSLALLDQIHQNAQLPDADTLINADIDAVANEIAKLEALQVAALSDEERELVGEWRARGYTRDELLAAVRTSLKTPRRSSAPPRTLKDCARQLTAHAPKQPSDYERAVIRKEAKHAAHSRVVAFRDVFERLPNRREFQVVETAVTMYGERDTFAALQRVKRVEDLMGVLDEQHAAEITETREQLKPELDVKQVLRLYEQTFGMPPTAVMPDEVRELMRDNDLFKNLDNWQTAFEHAHARNAKGWGNYLLKILRNPSPSMFTPEPINDVARAAFEQFRKRVGRLDALVAREVNEAAQTVTDTARWMAAFDTAARANALNWNYIKKVLTNPSAPKQPYGKQTIRNEKGYNRAARREQEQYTDEQRTAARERAKQRLETKKQNSGSSNSPKSN